MLRSEITEKVCLQHGGVTTFKSQLEEDAGREVDADLAGGWLGGREVAASSGRLPDVVEFRCLMEG